MRREIIRIATIIYLRTLKSDLLYVKVISSVFILLFAFIIARFDMLIYI